MQTLFIVCISAFGLAALTWFTVWAVWIHAPEGWLGKRAVTGMHIPQVDKVRHARWFRWLKIGTILLGLIALAAFCALISAHPW